VAAVLEAVAIRSPGGYTWLGQAFETDPSRLAGARNGDGPPWIARLLHARLYADFYLTGGPAPASAAAWRPEADRGATIEGLSAANAGRGSRQPGWSVRGADDRGVVVEREGLALWARPDQVLGEEGDSAGGSEVALLMPAERLGAAEGFFTIFGDAGNGGDRAIDRLYWHVRRDGAAALIAAASEILNREGLPFRLKVVNHARGFRRCDSAVLYTRRADRPVVLPLAAILRRRVASHMREAVPALALKLAAGLGFAEDPGGGESYGSHRCRLIADAVVTAWRAGERSPERRLRCVEERFRAAGLDLSRPYLGPGSPDDPRLTGPFT
jgi:hypothetical protein